MKDLLSAIREKMKKTPEAYFPMKFVFSLDTLNEKMDLLERFRKSYSPLIRLYELVLKNAGHDASSVLSDIEEAKEQLEASYFNLGAAAFSESFLEKHHEWEKVTGKTWDLLVEFEKALGVGVHHIMSHAANESDLLDQISIFSRFSKRTIVSCIHYIRSFSI